METKSLADTITIGMIGIGVVIVVGYYLKNKLTASAKIAWSNTPTLHGFLTFLFVGAMLVGSGGIIAGTWVGVRLLVVGSPAEAQIKKGK